MEATHLQLGRLASSGSDAYGAMGMGVSLGSAGGMWPPPGAAARCGAHQLASGATSSLSLSPMSSIPASPRAPACVPTQGGGAWVQLGQVQLPQLQQQQQQPSSGAWAIHAGGGPGGAAAAKAALVGSCGASGDDASRRMSSASTTSSYRRRSNRPLSEDQQRIFNDF